MAIAATWWKQQKFEFQQQKWKGKLEFQKEFQKGEFEFLKEFQRRKLEFEKALLEFQKGEFEFQKEFQRRKLEFEKALLEFQKEFQRRKLEFEKGKFELKKAGLELEDKKEEEERRRIETVIKNAHTIFDMEKFSDSEAADFIKLVLDKWSPLHQLLHGNTDLHAIRWRSFLPKPLAFGGRYVLDTLNQEGIKGWDRIRKDVCADYKGRGFEHLQVSYVEGTEPDQLGGKSMYASDEAQANVGVEHYAACGLCFAVLLESIFRVLDKDKALPRISVKVLVPVQTSNGKRIPHVEVEVERSSSRCRFLIELKSLKRKGDDIQEETRAKRSRVPSSDQKSDESDESEENNSMSKKKQRIVPSDDSRELLSPLLQTARGQIGEIHMARQSHNRVQSGFVSSGVHVITVRTDSTKSEDHFKASRVLKIVEGSDIKIGEARSLDMDSRGVDQVLKEVVIALIKAGFLPQSLLQGDASGAAGLRTERMEVSVDEEQLVQPVKAEAAEKEHRYLFPVTIHGSRLKAWIKAATVDDRYKQVQRELLIRQYLCPEDSVKARAVVWRGVPALLLEDAGHKINRDTMTPEDVFHMTKAIYMVLSHVYGEHGISHNDVAPRNICRDENGRYRLIDWGLASRLPDIDHPTNVPDWLYSGTCFFSGSQTPGIHSDLESLVYVALDCLHVPLPWVNAANGSDVIKIRRRFRSSLNSPVLNALYLPLLKAWLELEI
ncbi:uncharacterized protein LOC9641234 [Selaginella moellendorffii]|uniref:uncharacterized protein LOC9641234 n=1 Tax=Selaginella moellendorffii TaxID=88036 RepID=UPI000D1C5223|nr:uncharacterized protein LOC9641234 [Selaginella moellendorffii]|eukprot:XP_024523899.1 uncharacterized protein LOC9641234 [Selaginella moellendorffii]